jgi:hypothetical protein
MPKKINILLVQLNVLAPEIGSQITDESDILAVLVRAIEASLSLRVNLQNSDYGWHVELTDLLNRWTFHMNGKTAGEALIRAYVEGLLVSKNVREKFKLKD